MCASDREREKESRWKVQMSIILTFQCFMLPAQHIHVPSGVQALYTIGNEQYTNLLMPLSCRLASGLKSHDSIHTSRFQLHFASTFYAFKLLFIIHLAMI